VREMPLTIAAALKGTAVEPPIFDECSGVVVALLWRAGDFCTHFLIKVRSQRCLYPSTLCV
jgi:hypothetical protein